MAADPDLGELEDILGHAFVEPSLLGEAVTHASVSGGYGGHGDYERLEFLGHRVLSLVVAELPTTRLPAAPERDPALPHVALVRREPPAEIARPVALGPAPILYNAQPQSTGREPPAPSADSL